jgi:transposase
MDLGFLDLESRPDVLREFAKVALLETFRVKQEMAFLKSASNEQAEQIRLAFQDKLLRLKTKLFGRGQEKTDDGLRSRGAGDVLAHGESLNPSNEPKQKKSAKDRQIPERDMLYEMSADELKAEASLRGYPDAKTCDWKELDGLYDQSSTITVIERVYEKQNHKRKKYVFLPSRGSDKEIIVAAKGPDKLAAGCEYSADFAIAVTCDKFQYHVPLNRQIDQMKKKGLFGITSKTLFKLTELLYERTQKASVVEKIRSDILSVPLAVHADETGWSILNGRDSDGHLWSICNMAGAYYRYEPTRSGKIALEMLKGYSGPVMSDAYSGYNRVRNQTSCPHGLCWAHGRRNFYEIRANHPDDCTEILRMIDELFDVEREAGFSFEKLKILRKEKSREIVDRIKKWLEKKQLKYLMKNDEMGRSIRYFLNHWKEFTLFLDDIRVPLSNNHAERTLRHSVLGRKNYYGSKTINGADVAAEHFTIIETCKLVNLDPPTYYRYLVKTSNAGEEVLSPLGYVKHLWETKKAAA